ncbi:hypothetical protein [Pandoraea commovens]|uniref:Uncharacterized protein n=1 Tax=Pandoraea commovens TaxID=2508289 RepID=A0A5E4SX56_9BURK|nr:hypothetical protein [Pandoraea commovens]UVA77771.1 hypothetical protein NTU39_16940 [Pandoraea commovens]VVD79028.1 hypothetical protein PCO31010_01041 [Pandoraea commovens]
MNATRVDYQRWISLRRRVPANEYPVHPLPDRLPRRGYVVWFYFRNEFFGSQFDKKAKAYVCDHVRNPWEAAFLETKAEALDIARRMVCPCLVLYCAGPSAAVTAVA